MAEPRPLPLFAWRQAQTQRQAARRERRRRLTVGLGIALGAMALMAPGLSPWRPRLVWNATASEPRGLYWIGAGKPLVVGDTVLVWLPDAARILAARRHYLPANVPAVKRVAAVAGQRVCAEKAIISIDGRPVARRFAADGWGRPMPDWQGCHRLRAGEVLLLNPAAPKAFDSRYFGVVSASAVIGKARLLWAR